MFTGRNIFYHDSMVKDRIDHIYLDFEMMCQICKLYYWCMNLFFTIFFYHEMSFEFFDDRIALKFTMKYVQDLVFKFTMKCALNFGCHLIRFMIHIQNLFSRKFTLFIGRTIFFTRFQDACSVYKINGIEFFVIFVYQIFILNLFIFYV